MAAQRPVGAGVGEGCSISPVWSSDRISVTASVSLDGRACAGWVPLARMGVHYSPSLIASEAAGRLNSDELIEVEIDDGLESCAGAAVLDGLGQCLEPDSVLGL
jgi:hypothetical protein